MKVYTSVRAKTVDFCRKTDYDRGVAKNISIMKGEEL